MGLFDIFTTDDQNKAAQDQISGINKGIGDLTSSFGQGRDAINTNYADALKPYSQNYSVASGGQNLLAQLLGIPGAGGGGGAGGGAPGAPGGGGGGTPGTPDIQSLLSSLPGYQFTLDQGDQNILRNQAATGQLNSGKTNLDLQKFGQGTANQNYTNFLQQLQPFLGAAGNAAGGVAGVKTGQGNALNANFTGVGNAQYGADTSVGNANANADLAGLTASSNLWGAIGGAGKALLGAGGIPGAGGLAGLLPKAA